MENLKQRMRLDDEMVSKLDQGFVLNLMNLERCLQENANRKVSIEAGLTERSDEGTLGGKSVWTAKFYHKQLTVKQHSVPILQENFTSMYDNSRKGNEVIKRFEKQNTMKMTSGLVIHKGRGFPVTRKCTEVEKKISAADPRQSLRIETNVVRDG